MSARRPPPRRPLGWRPYVKRTPTDPFYQSIAWRCTRQAILRRDCYRCTWVEDGQRCTARAVVVDHIVARSAGGAPLDPANLRGLCRQHDAGRHAEQGGIAP